MRSTNASTVSGEQARQEHQRTHKGVFRGLQQKIGIITEVHETLPLVKAVFLTGANVAGGDYFPVAHSVMDILQRFGTLRPGLRVMITYSGEVESEPYATIIGVEDEKLGGELQQDNEMNTPLYALFTPGT